MRRKVSALLLAAGLLAACSAAGTEGSRCDDGGEGGVVIDGVCL
jgi:hypothetical protein